MTSRLDLKFCIVGAMKSATTTLADLLGSHPGIVMANPKEPGFFSRNERFSRGPEWYESLFSNIGGRVAGEASTCYSRRVPFPEAARRLAEFAPRVQLIYVLRHPADRAIAHYVHEMRIRFSAGARPVGFDEYCATDPSVIATSEYDLEIKHLLEWFNRDRLMLIRFEDLVANQTAVTDRVVRWLRLTPAPVQAVWQNQGDANLRRKAVRQSMNTLTNSRAAEVSRKVLPAPLRAAGRYLAYHVIAHSPILRRNIESFESALDIPEGQRRKILVRRFADTVSAVEAMTQWNLSAWRK